MQIAVEWRSYGDNHIHKGLTAKRSSVALHLRYMYGAVQQVDT